MMGEVGKHKYDNYLTVRALEDNFTLSFSNVIEYCIHSDNSWVSLSANSSTPAIRKGDAISFRATFYPTSFTVGCGSFSITKACNLEGNCMSLLFGDDAEGKTDISTFTTGVFGSLFKNCTGIRSVSKNFLPAATIVRYCYLDMFNSCTNMTTAPDLPAGVLFNDCYYGTFRNCVSLVDAPDLPAVSLVSNCYNYMFYMCSSLNYIKALFTTTPSYSYTRYWLTGTASSGTFVKSKDATWTLVGDHGIPKNWTIITE